MQGHRHCLSAVEELGSCPLRGGSYTTFQRSLFTTFWKTESKSSSLHSLVCTEVPRAVSGWWVHLLDVGFLSESELISIKDGLTTPPGQECLLVLLLRLRHSSQPMQLRSPGDSHLSCRVYRSTDSPALLPALSPGPQSGPVQWILTAYISWVPSVVDRERWR